MEYMYELKEKLCDELEEIARKPEMGAGDLEIIHKLTDTIKNIDKIEIMKENGGYSQAGDWEMRGTYDRGSSYRRKRDSMGRYARDGRDDGYSGRMMPDRIYSRADAKEHMMDELEEAMAVATTDREKDIIKRAMDQLEKA